jgi:hypothetical protein
MADMKGVWDERAASQARARRDEEPGKFVVDEKGNVS